MTIDAIQRRSALQPKVGLTHIRNVLTLITPQIESRENPLLRFLPQVTLVIVINCFTAVSVSPVWADAIPGSYNAPWAYYSTDMSPIEVNFATIKFDEANGTYKTGHLDPVTKQFVEGEPIAKAVLPRAYINVFHPYSSKNKGRSDFQVDVLPDRIFGDNLTITMTYPDGLPYSIVYETWPKHKPDLNLPGAGVEVDEWNDYEQTTRAIRMSAEIVASDPIDSRTQVDSTLRIAGEKMPTKFEGFSHHKKLPSRWEHYFDDGPDEIRQISCLGPVEKSNANNFCKYNFPINSKLFARLEFLDFRLHGGREFARERIRVFKKVMCPVFLCDEKALRAANVKGDGQ